LVGWLVGRLVGWLVGWLVGCFSIVALISLAGCVPADPQAIARV
jgi:hypothetical protein